MLNKLIVLVFLFISISASAHQPEGSSTMLVEKENNTWILQISASLTAFQQEINTHFSETPYKTPEEFRQMVIEHIKNNLDITFNENQGITLSAGTVKLGHETQVVFEVYGVPSEIKSIVFKNSVFKDIYNNQSALMVFKEGFNKQRFVLNNKNNHSLKLQADQDTFVLESKNEASFLSTKILFLVIGILAVSYISKAIVTKKL
jgi:hypothetical protein